MSSTVSQIDLHNTFEQASPQVVVVRPDPEMLTQARSPHFVGISAHTAGAKALSMNLVIIPPGATAEPHFHPQHETIVYLLNGRVEIRYGEELQHCQICEAGDFVFTPPGVPHQPRNLSETEPVYLVSARNDSSEREETVPYVSTIN